jgi:hypothetical protein
MCKFYGMLVSPSEKHKYSDNAEYRQLLKDYHKVQVLLSSSRLSIKMLRSELDAACDALQVSENEPPRSKPTRWSSRSRPKTWWTFLWNWGRGSRPSSCVRKPPMTRPSPWKQWTIWSSHRSASKLCRSAFEPWWPKLFVRGLPWRWLLPSFRLVQRWTSGWQSRVFFARIEGWWHCRSGREFEPATNAS